MVDYLSLKSFITLSAEEETEAETEEKEEEEEVEIEDLKDETETNEVNNSKIFYDILIITL
jgi:hypothetical protein